MDSTTATILAAVLSAVLSAIFGGVVAWFVSRSVNAKLAEHQRQINADQAKDQRKLQLVLDLYTEFQSREMLEARTEAAMIIAVHGDALSQGFAVFRSRLKDDNEWFQISRIIHFIEKLAIFYIQQDLDKGFADKTLMRYFRYWYITKNLKAAIQYAAGHEDDEWHAFVEPIVMLADNLSIKLPEQQAMTLRVPSQSNRT